MKVARAKGRLRGKKPKLSQRQEAHLVALHHAGTHTSAELAELFSVARSTVYRAIERGADHSSRVLTPDPYLALLVSFGSSGPTCSAATCRPQSPSTTP
jgi:DNA invertase Pin-like site-specific DNA recombinase